MLHRIDKLAHRPVDPPMYIWLVTIATVAGLGLAGWAAIVFMSR
jgi:hypothetical protein